MFFIHHSAFISPIADTSDLENLGIKDAIENKLMANEPPYGQIPKAALRRMGKAVRMTVGAALPLLNKLPVCDGIVLGTANAGLEDSMKFMDQIIQHKEGLLAPANFVQSTPNGPASQIALVNKNSGYNITHVHHGHAFENAALDVLMLLKENPSHNYLLGAVDEISAYNYNLEFLAGRYKKENISNKALYTSETPGSIAGEGTAMFAVNSSAKGAIAEMRAIKTCHLTEQSHFVDAFKIFLQENLPASEKIDVLISGENGDIRLLPGYLECERECDNNTTILRYKHFTGEFPTASAQAFFLGCEILKSQKIPEIMIKKRGSSKEIKNIVLCNNFAGKQFSFVWLRQPKGDQIAP